jgi:DNA primase
MGTGVDTHTDGGTGKRFSERFIDDVKARTSIVDLIGESLKLTKKGREHTSCCPFHKEKTPSFKVNEEKAFYKCFGCGASGSVFDWMMEARGLTFVEAVEELAIRAGLQPDRDGRTKPKPAPKVERPSDDDLMAEKENSIRYARRIWDEAERADGTIIGTYLKSRGIHTRVPPTIRFHPNLKHTDTGLYFPAMVAAVQDADRRVVGVHRTYLLPDGRGKAQVNEAKKTLGACRHNSIRLCEQKRVLYLAEGIETALSVFVATGKMPWVVMWLGNFDAKLPRYVQEVVLCIDNDSKPDTHKLKAWMAETDTSVEGLADMVGCADERAITELLDGVWPDPAVLSGIVLVSGGRVTMDDFEKTRREHKEIIRKATEFHSLNGRAVRIAEPIEGCDFSDMLTMKSHAHGSGRG